MSYIRVNNLQPIKKLLAILVLICASTLSGSALAQELHTVAHKETSAGFAGFSGHVASGNKGGSFTVGLHNGIPLERSIVTLDVGYFEPKGANSVVYGSLGYEFEVIRNSYIGPALGIGFSHEFDIHSYESRYATHIMPGLGIRSVVWDLVHLRAGYALERGLFAGYSSQWNW